MEYSAVVNTPIKVHIASTFRSSSNIYKITIFWMPNISPRWCYNVQTWTLPGHEYVGQCWPGFRCQKSTKHKERRRGHMHSVVEDRSSWVSLHTPQVPLATTRIKHVSTTTAELPLVRRDIDMTLDEYGRAHCIVGYHIGFVVVVVVVNLKRFPPQKENQNNRLGLEHVSLGFRFKG